jgi:3-keto-disaccharide hydrolase/Glycosyl hydrolase family 20, catalytic domain
MKTLPTHTCLFAILVAMNGMASARGTATGENQKPWRAVHMMAPGHGELPLLKQTIDEAFKPLGINVLILEVNYGFEFQSHPELRQGNGLTRSDAHELAAFCQQRGIDLIPQLNCLGHQSWARSTAPLLKKYPQFDETPNVPADNKGIYCRSWCPLHPDVNKVVFALIDEMADAFSADSFHVGMDEVFLVASDQCSRCRGKDPAEVFARAVNDLHSHIVKDKKLAMLMWGDRLLDDKAMHYGKWESSANGTAPAIDRIPKDIIQCDWHYELREHYPSVAFFQEKGFRVLPSSWNNPKASLAFLEDARRVNKGLVIGHMGTTWTGAEAFCRAMLNPQPAAELPEGRRAGAQGAAAALRACMKAIAEPSSVAEDFPEGKWTSLFNGKDLSGWTPKIKGSALGENYLDTFRVGDGVIKVCYDRYKTFNGEFGHLFYKHPFSAYKLRVEYRFVGDQVPGGPGWAFRNSGAMIHCQPPETMGKDQEFPVSIEVQFLGGSGRGKRPTASVCSPGTHIVMNGKLITQHCNESRSKTYDGDQWVTVEAEVHGNGVIKHFVNGELVIEYEKPQLDDHDPDAQKLIAQRHGERMLKEGYISLQAESHPIEFRKVEIMPLGE